MFESKSVVIRPIENKDLNLLSKWKNDESIYKYLGGGFSPVSIDQYANWMESLITIDDKNKRFAICNMKNEIVGMIGLYNINQTHRTAEIGMFIGDSRSRGLGIATDTHQIIERYAKNYLNIRKLKLLVVKNNEQASNFWKKLNYLEIGSYSKERYIDGEYLDVIIMEKFI